MSENGTILVVDDDNELRDGLTTLLGEHGYRTLGADDGVQASQLIDQHRPDLVILDMMMPRWGGLAVLERFCGKSGAPPFLMMTANEGTKHRAYAEQLGVVDYFRKPFNMSRLLERVGQIVPPRGAAPESAATVVRCRCAGCGARIKAPVQLLRQTRSCPGCKQLIVIAYAPPEDEGPKLVMA